MTNLKAIAIATGFEETATSDELVDACQYLIDSGLAWRVQGWYRETATLLIAEGVCTNYKGALHEC